MSQKIIAIDFDGTIVGHEYPEIGEYNPGALDWMYRWQKAGALLILYTMRSGETLKDAVNYVKGYSITLFGVNVNPQQHKWTTSPKVYAHRYVDDAAFGCPLRPSSKTNGRPMVDWDIVGPAILNWIESNE